MDPEESGHGESDIPAKRRRDAAATREAILRSAVAAFTRSGYDGVGVREIAQGAGVTAMLVNRYFGSKEQLFAEAVDVAFAPRTVVTGDDVRTLSRDAARMLVARTAPEADQLGPFLLMLRSASNPRAVEIIRASTERHVGRHLTDLLPGAGAGERAELLLSLIAGVWMMRKVIGTTALAGADPTLLSGRIEALFRLLVEPDTDHEEPTNPTGA
ncbi:TetR/AcrR family transcriptional regulator [Streptosporangium subroseum]|uniref:TetR/AcrR family transcriptional regulator n=1 Tax=Streptosporangium subroseum TaxID=106412 RepID=UPI003088E14B|nr:TetR/AcrR family transcriptional regulator [Streptosporangium subroseum]